MALFLLLLLPAMALAAEPEPKFEAGKTEILQALGYEWDAPRAKDWSIEGGVLRMLIKGPAVPQPRRPMQYVIARTPSYRKVTMKLEVERNGKSLILIYAWRDPAHFNYAHLSSDAAKQVIVHNGMFHVYGGERVRISGTEGPATLPEAAWTKVKLVHDGATGRAYVEVNGQRNASLEAVDLSITEGRIGLGSFFDLGAFRNLKIIGN
jgi:hypothetical protein